MLTLVIPSYAGGENIERTIRSVPMADELVIISTALFLEDDDHFHSLTNKVVTLPWNYVFTHGFGVMHNQGTSVARNDWLLLFGVGETMAEYGDILGPLRSAVPQTVFRCWHYNDVNTWIRIWNRTGGTFWSGIIHEQIVFGHDGGLLFRMQDTEKTPMPDPYKHAALKFLKILSYNWNYQQLFLDSNKVGGSGVYWLQFVQGAIDEIRRLLAQYQVMLDACVTGNKQRFLDEVKRAVDAEMPTNAVNFLPQGA